MTPDIRIPWAFAAAVADEVVAELTSFCTRIEVAGSIRRRRETVKDVEIVAVPVTRPAQVDMLGAPIAPPTDMLNLYLEEHVKGKAGKWKLRPGKDGRTTFGPLNKLLLRQVDTTLHPDGWMPIDVFTASPLQCEYAYLRNLSMCIRPEEQKGQHGAQSLDLQQKVFRAVDMDEKREGTAPSAEAMPGLRNHIRDIPTVSPDLFKSVRRDLSRPERNLGARQAADDPTPRLSVGISPATSEPEQERLRAATSLSYGDGARTDARAQRVGAPQERTEGRQPPGQSPDSYTRSPPRTGDMPVLSQRLPSSLICPRCGGPMISPNWGRDLWVRTGPADLNTAVATLAMRAGTPFHAYGPHAFTGKLGDIQCPDEGSFARVLGIPCRPPRERTNEWAVELLKRGPAR